MTSIPRNILDQILIIKLDEQNLKFNAKMDPFTKKMSNYINQNYNSKVNNYSIIIVCTQNSRSSTDKHFQHSFKEFILKNQDFKMLSKVDATRQTNRTAFGSIVSNVRTRVYYNVKKVGFEFDIEYFQHSYNKKVANSNTAFTNTREGHQNIPYNQNKLILTNHAIYRKTLGTKSGYISVGFRLKGPLVRSYGTEYPTYYFIEITNSYNSKNNKKYSNSNINESKILQLLHFGRSYDGSNIMKKSKMIGMANYLSEKHYTLTKNINESSISVNSTNNNNSNSIKTNSLNKKSVVNNVVNNTVTNSVKNKNNRNTQNTESDPLLRNSRLNQPRYSSENNNNQIQTLSNNNRFYYKASVVSIMNKLINNMNIIYTGNEKHDINFADFKNNSEEKVEKKLKVFDFILGVNLIVLIFSKEFNSITFKAQLNNNKMKSKIYYQRIIQILDSNFIKELLTINPDSITFMNKLNPNKTDPKLINVNDFYLMLRNFIILSKNYINDRSRPSINNRALYIQSSIGDNKNIHQLGDYSGSISNTRSDFYNKIGNTYVDSAMNFIKSNNRNAHNQIVFKMLNLLNMSPYGIEKYNFIKQKYTR